jgi:hypothetical protein
VSKHTPGPWSVQKRSFIISVAAKHGAFCSLGVPTDEREATAHLIAAAPDLLAACEEALVFAENNPVPPIVKSRLERAIAKAKGER